LKKDVMRSRLVADAITNQPTSASPASASSAAAKQQDGDDHDGHCDADDKTHLLLLLLHQRQSLQQTEPLLPASLVLLGELVKGHPQQQHQEQPHRQGVPSLLLQATSASSSAASPAVLGGAPGGVVTDVAVVASNSLQIRVPDNAAPGTTIQVRRLLFLLFALFF
jgi:hypothetical protein